MVPVGLIGFMLPQVLEVGFYADPPKNKLDLPNDRPSTGDALPINRGTGKSPITNKAWFARQKYNWVRDSVRATFQRPCRFQLASRDDTRALQSGRADKRKEIQFLLGTRKANCGDNYK
jgi:hypothetical protein